MRRFLLAAALGLVVTQAGAASIDQTTPEFKAYTSFSFGGSQSQSLGLHYGLRMDRSNYENQWNGLNKPAIMQVDFSQSAGFESAKLYGIPLTTPKFEALGLAEPSVAGKLLWFSGFFILGGLVYGISEATRNDSAPPAAAPACQPRLTIDGGLNALACPVDTKE